METNHKILCVSFGVFLIFISIGITQCFFVNRHSCWKLNGACPGVWIPFVYIVLPYLFIYGKDRNNIWKYLTIAIYISVLPALLALVCSTADAICTEINDDLLARTFSQIVAILNTIFAVPLSFAALSLCGIFVCSFLPKRLVQKRMLNPGEGAYQDIESSSNGPMYF